MATPDFIKNIIIAVAVPIIIKVADKSIPREKIVEFAQKLGQGISEANRKALGSQGESLETLGQEIINLFIANLNIGLDKDDTV